MEFLTCNEDKIPYKTQRYKILLSDKFIRNINGPAPANDQKDSEDLYCL